MHVHGPSWHRSISEHAYSYGNKKKREQAPERARIGKDSRLEKVSDSDETQRGKKHMDRGLGGVRDPLPENARVQGEQRPGPRAQGVKGAGMLGC